MTIVTQQNLFVFWWEHKNKPVSGWTTRWISSPLKNSQQKQYEHKKPTLTRLSFPYILLKQTALSLSVRDELLKSSPQTRFVSTEAEKERNRRPLLLKWWILSISGTLKKLLQRRGCRCVPKTAWTSLLGIYFSLPRWRTDSYFPPKMQFFHLLKPYNRALESETNSRKCHSSGGLDDQDKRDWKYIKPIEKKNSRKNSVNSVYTTPFRESFDIL